MATETKLRQLADKECPVYYFYSSERYLVRQAVAAATRILTADSDEDATVLDGVAPEIEQLIMAAGTISFFGTRRVVVLPEIDPAAYSDKDLEELNSTLSSLENAVVVLGSVFELERSKLKTGKRAQKLIAQCKALGYTEELAKPKPFELKMMMIDRAKEQKTTLPDGAAAALLERCGEDPFLLENEVDKLCAFRVSDGHGSDGGGNGHGQSGSRRVRDDPHDHGQKRHRCLQKAADFAAPAAGAHCHYSGHDRQLCGSVPGQAGGSKTEKLQHGIQGFWL